MRKRRLIFIIVAALCLAVPWIAWGNKALEVKRSVVCSDRLPEAFDGFVIVQISDLHNAQFGDENQKLLDMLSGTEPDIIVLTGDFIDSHRTDIDISIAFAKRAVQIAPVYYVTGNHEAVTPEYGKLRAGLEDAGVVLLEDASVLLERSGAAVRLLGIDDPAFEADLRKGDSETVVRTKLRELAEQDGLYTILLSHRPELFDIYVESGVDMVFSGHAHGGQFRLPFVGGLVAPNQGLFPKYDAGLYTESGTSMMVSRGVGNSIIPFRINNRPEIVVVELRN